MNRKEAKSLGLKFYRGVLCKEKHDSERYVSNGECIECSSKRNKRWMIENKTARDEYRKTYVASHSEQIKAYSQSDFCKKMRQGINKKRQAKGLLAYNRMMCRIRELNCLAKWDDELTDLVGREAHNLTKLREKFIGSKWNVDHIVPLKGKEVCGLHVWNNLQVIPELVNKSKFNFLGVDK